MDLSGFVKLATYGQLPELKLGHARPWSEASLPPQKVRASLCLFTARYTQVCMQSMHMQHPHTA
jgi:hypothetical protein